MAEFLLRQATKVDNFSSSVFASALIRAIATQIAADLGKKNAKFENGSNCPDMSRFAQVVKKV